MKFTQEGEWIISTPLYAGSSDDVAKAVQCLHEFSQESSTDVTDTEEGRILVIYERCVHCHCARRFKYKKLVSEKES